MQYLVIIERNEDDSGFGAYVPDLPGCVATGQTDAEAKEWISFSIPLHLDSLRARMGSRCRLRRRPRKLSKS